MVELAQQQQAVLEETRREERLRLEQQQAAVASAKLSASQVISFPLPFTYGLFPYNP